jgi:hypothetical protein
MTHNVLWLCEGKGLEALNFKLRTMIDRITNVEITENALLLAIPC